MAYYCDELISTAMTVGVIVGFVIMFYAHTLIDIFKKRKEIRLLELQSPDFIKEYLRFVNSIQLIENKDKNSWKYTADQLIYPKQEAGERRQKNGVRTRKKVGND